MIKMLTSVASESFTVSAGDITDKFSDAEEKRYIEAGLAEPVVKKVTKKKTKK